jgi:hypothetical protein
MSELYFTSLLVTSLASFFYYKSPDFDLFYLSPITAASLPNDFWPFVGLADTHVAESR